MNQTVVLLLFLAVLALPMVLMSRRQKKAMAQQQELQNSLNVGDRVMTMAGLYGTVVDTSDDATIDIEIAPGVTSTWLRQAIREKVGPDQHDDDDDELVDDVDDVNTPATGAEIAPPLEHGKSS